ncbi:hypothetical protein ACI8AC_03305 [Geodermatophilus sp. SYSU D00758]
MSTDVPPQARAPRRPLLVALGLLAALLAVAAVVLLTGGEDGSPHRGTAAAATSAAPTAPSTAPAPGPQPPAEQPDPPTGPPPEPVGGVVADELPPSLPAVPLDRPAESADGLSATVAGIEAIEGTGVGPGNMSGPALRVTVLLRNGTAEPVDLAGVAVDLAHGGERLPASPLDDPSAAPFSGTLEQGGSAEGVYVFTVPADDRDSVTVSVSPRAGAPFLVFTGAVG